MWLSSNKLMDMLTRPLLLQEKQCKGASKELVNLFVCDRKETLLKRFN